MKSLKQLLLPDKLLSQWHPTKNQGIEPCQTSFGSYEYIWWVCSKGHEWGATIRERYKKNLECSDCVREERALKRSYQFEEVKSETLAEADPELCLQWHPSRNKNLAPADVNSKEDWPQRWWMCQRGHEWEETVKDRVHNLKSVCVYCSDKKAYEKNSLAAVYPELVNEWSTVNNDKSPHDVVYNSNEEVAWVCEKGHVWRERIRKRIKNNSRCPECIKFEQSLFSMYPEIAAEWHPDRNGTLFGIHKTPKDVSVTSYNNVWWLCRNCGEEYTARVKDRVKGVGCISCSS